jgi:nucleoside-diphosphate-sugar epimerase
MSPATLVTGAFGCIGAWTARLLVDRGERPILLDYSTDPWRLRMVAGEDRLEKATILQGDVADRERIGAVVREHRVNRIIHLAAWQVPLCRQDPVGGARVNVVGTASVFEAARQNPGQVERVVYASSAAVFGPAHLYPSGPLADDAPRLPTTHYGVYKVANEDTAKAYWAEHRIPSVGFRPLSVYGPGRDFGVTADPTIAIKAAVLGRPFHVRWGGKSDLIYVADVAGALLAAADSGLEGARVYNLHGEVVPVAEMVRTIEEAWPSAKGLITHAPEAMPFADSLADHGFQRDLGPKPRTPFRDGLRQTLDEFARLKREGRLDAREFQGPTQAPAAFKESRT